MNIPKVKTEDKKWLPKRPWGVLRDVIESNKWKETYIKNLLDIVPRKFESSKQARLLVIDEENLTVNHVIVF